MLLSSVSTKGLNCLLFFRIVAEPIVRTIREAPVTAGVLLKLYLYMPRTVLRSHGYITGKLAHMTTKSVSTIAVKITIERASAKLPLKEIVRICKIDSFLSHIL